MALREIRDSKDPILRMKSRRVEEVDERIRSILQDMADTMYHAGGGGLAACQVGILKRLVVVDMGEGLHRLVNPELVWGEGEQLVVEGCLSLPQVWGRLKRPALVKVRALDEWGKPLLLEAAGPVAKCLCHEIDHLNGILFTDHIIEYVEI